MFKHALLLSTFCFTSLTAQQPPAVVIKFITSFPGEEFPEPPLAAPLAISIDLEGNIFVLDSGNNRIVKFDTSGIVLATVGDIGWGKEQFDNPLDITAESSLDVFVADFNNERIERYDKDLNFISSFYSDENTQSTLQFGFPVGLEISKHGELFIADNESNRVLKLNSFGVPVLSFGDFNWGEGQLAEVGPIEISENDLLYVSDSGKNDIVVFDYYGNFLTRFGEGLLNKPRGLCAAEGYLYIADSGNNRIVVFDDNYRVVLAWGAAGKQFGAFNNPTDVAVSGNRVFVLDAGNGRIQVFVVRMEIN